MNGGGWDVAEALRGEGPLFAAMLADRARELARPPADADIDTVAVLVLAGAAGRWALPLAAASRVEPLGICEPLPDQPAAVLGLTLLAGRRCVVADPDAALAARPRRPPDRPGHAVLLRTHGLALAVDRAEAISHLPRLPVGNRVLADGSLLIDVDRLAAALAYTGAA